MFDFYAPKMIILKKCRNRKKMKRVKFPTNWILIKIDNRLMK